MFGYGDGALLGLVRGLFLGLRVSGVSWLGPQKSLQSFGQCPSYGEGFPFFPGLPLGHFLRAPIKPLVSQKGQNVGRDITEVSRDLWLVWRQTPFGILALFWGEGSLFEEGAKTRLYWFQPYKGLGTF